MKTVLIIDDEEKLRGLLARIIRAEGFDVVEAANLKDGHKQLATKQVDVVLCDVKLPDGNGVDFLSAVKPKYPCIEIILLTAYGNIADGVQAMRNGAFDYITKGDDNDKIIPLLHPNVEMITTMAIMVSAGLPRILYITAVPKRSSDAYCMPRCKTPMPDASPRNGKIRT